MLDDSLETRRDQVRRSAESMLLRARQQGRETLNQGESARYQAALADLRELDSEIERRGQAGATITALSTRIRNANTNPGRRPAVSTHVYENLTYRRGDHRHSYIRDLVRVSLNRDDDGSALGRLHNHAQDVATMPEYAEYRDLSRVDGSGGYAVPPAWLMDQYIELARPGRAFANLVQRQPLPGGTDSINIPKILTGTATAIQPADNTPVTDVDLTDTFINAPVRTISGQQGVAIQLLDQSPIAFDDVIFRDLVADYAAKLDQQCLSGSGTYGQVLGVDLTPGITTIAVSSVTTQGVYSGIANAIQTVHTTRFLPPEAIVMHPRRWGWFLSLLDNQDRPLFLPAANSPMNVAGVLTEVASQQVVGQMQGLPVITDPNITTSAGSGSPVGSEDIIYVLRASDVVLWESGVRARVLPEAKAQNLTVLLQIFGYLAFSAARYPQSIVELTGLTAPTW